MSTPRIADGIAAAMLFARGRAEGLLLLPPTEAGALHSFRAALICLPAFLGLRLLAWSQQGAPRGGLVLGLLAELVGFVLSWAGFALASRVLAEQAQRLGRWPHFLAAWNWSNLVQYLLLAVLAVPVLLGAPTWLSNAMGLVALGYALWLEWFVTREALGVVGATAVMFVLLDVAIGLFIGGLSARIAGGG
ncbi:hypothetical protein [Sabulicella glaciei]|uniref:Yip1 domain-containing protein n=1 Tax=Sabulicella glaciei TaxID=2984948 RepID=A0ABT3NWV3_9PROT|nr:hypothetical protein [Roseococcus sp. MDT2-1-1]MCW8086378.1 hypothetical protein [Roseococcus sp. MDT2-1-1]